jgi:hypothetical protein
MAESIVLKLESTMTNDFLSQIHRTTTDADLDKLFQVASFEPGALLTNLDIIHATHE